MRWSGKVFADFRHHPIKIPHHVVVLKSQYTNTRTSKKFVPQLVMTLRGIVVVDSAVKLDRKPLFRAVEVQYVMPDTVLTAKFPAQ